MAAGAMALASPRDAHADAHATATPGSVEFAQLTWTEIRDALAQGWTSIVIPVGGTEQSGPFIAVGKHNVRATVLAQRIAQKAGHMLVAPTIAYVPEGGTAPRTSHMRFPGTISIPPAVFRELVSGAAESLRVQGFRRVILLGDHGGYQKDLKAVAQALNRKWAGTGAHVVYLAAYYDVIAGAYAGFLRRRGLGADVGMHADISDTSLMLAIRPDMVREDALRHAALPGASQGVYGGDPRPATAALGQVGADMQVAAALRALETDKNGPVSP
ncbi:creatininase family protein [Novacetimonas pomaceti]|uniref:creatininase family protein n=1 Tax=Novacetimonas pomaceti TaxID=2021998 RepID=UPI001C2DEDBD|nr:creatininase family protein [Novacetimonas pomaceti]